MLRGPKFLEFNSKIGGSADLTSDNLKNWGIYNLNSVIISLRILASQIGFNHCMMKYSILKDS